MPRTTRSRAINIAEQLTEPDSEVERSIHRRRREQKQKQIEDTSMAQQQQPQIQDNPPPRMALKDYTRPNAQDFRFSIMEPEIINQNFELKPGLIQMIQQSQFGGGLNENPNVHINKFIQLCNTLKVNGVSDEAIRLRLFPFSLRDRASEWLMSMPPNSFTTWDALSTAFLAKYFPPAKTARLRSEINNFTQKEGESLYEAWERLKDLLRQCPHHGVPQWIVLENFYNGLEQPLRNLIDSAAGGSLMAKTVEEAYNLIEDMALHNYQYGSIRGNTRRTGVYEVDALIAVSAQLEQLSKKFDKMSMNQAATPNTSCEVCGGEHRTSECLATNQNQTSEQVSAFNSNNPSYPRSSGNPFSNTYNPGWRNHPNFSWSNQQQPSTQSTYQNRPPGFQQRTFNPPPPQPQPPQNQQFHQTQKSHLEELLESYILNQKAKDEARNKKDEIFEQQFQQISSKLEQLDAHNKMLETQIAQQVAGPSQRNFGKLPSQTEPNPRGEVQAIILRSGKQVENQKAGKEQTDEEEEKGETSTPETTTKEAPPTITVEEEKKQPYVPPPPYKPPVPFPQRIQKAKLEKQFGKFLSTLQKLSINVPFIDALSQMPSYAKFLKEILSNKRKLEDYGTVALTGECSAILQHQLPPKLKDPGSFSIPCLLGNVLINNALCDLGASVSLIPLSICKKLKMGDPKPTTMSLQLADRSIKYPVGILEDVPIKVGKLFIPVDFVVLEMEEDKQIPIILGRPFLATAGAIIDVKNGRLTLKVGDEKVEFKLFSATKFSSQEDSCLRIDVIDQAVEEVIAPEKLDDALEAFLIQFATGACLEEKESLCVSVKRIDEKQDAENKEGQTPKVDLKPLPPNLRYAFLGLNSTFPVIINANLSDLEVEKLLKELRKHRKAIGYKIDDLVGINPSKGK